MCTVLKFNCCVAVPFVRPQIPPYDMASRSTDHSFASIKDSDPAPLEPDDIITGEDNENSLSCAAIDQHLSARRKNAANFKQLSKREDHYRRITVAQEEPSEHDLHTSSKIRNAISLRDKWVYRRDVPEWYNYDPPRHCDYSVFVPPPYHPFDETLPASSNQICQWQDGIVHVFSDRASVMRRKPDISSPPLSGFAEDLSRLMTIVNDPECRSLAYRRLVLLQERFNMHIILNEDEERLSQIRVPHRDFYNVRKVDVHGRLFSSLFSMAIPSADFRLIRSYRPTDFFHSHEHAQSIIRLWQIRSTFCVS